MNIDDLSKSTGEWLRGVGPMNDVVISSRVRLARNLKERPFVIAAGADDRADVFRTLTDAFCSTGQGRESLVVDLDQTEPVDRELLVERHLISRQHAAGEGARGVTICPRETLALMINEEDHLRIQALRSGLQVESLWEEVNELDDALSGLVEFAFDKQLGYLTACPTNVGTGLRVSFMLHLPALKLTKEIERVARAARDMRLAVRGVFGEGTDTVGDLYQVSNQTTLGRSEEEIVTTFARKIVPKIVEYERAARESLARHRSSMLDDTIWRAYGILANARRISGQETLSLLSPVRMGLHMGRIDAIDPRTLNELFLFAQPAHLQKRAGRSMDEEERATARAEYLRRRLAERPPPESSRN